MEMITAAIVGGLAYDAFKSSSETYLTYAKMALKDYLSTDEERAVVLKEIELSPVEARDSKEALIAYFEEKAPNTQKIVNKYQQVKNVHSGTGPIIDGGVTHSGTGDINIGVTTKEAPKKS